MNKSISFYLGPTGPPPESDNSAETLEEEREEGEEEHDVTFSSRL